MVKNLMANIRRSRGGGVLRSGRKNFVKNFFWLAPALAILSGCGTSVCFTKKDVDPDVADSRAWYRPEMVDVVDKGIRAADYGVVNSHVIGPATRPVSYAFRILTFSKDTVFDTLTGPASFFYQENAVPPPIVEGEGMDLGRFEKDVFRLTRRNPSRGEISFLIGGDEFFTRLEEEIMNAERSIDIRLFIFDNDDYAVRVADLLKEKSCQGVKVRVLLDAMGQVLGEGKPPSDLPENFTPPYSMVNYLKKDSSIQVRLRPSALLRGDHTKTIIIDEKVCFTGGMNIGREYRYHWHDMMVELKGPVLSEIMYEFDLAWAHSGFWGDLGYALARSFKQKPQLAAGDGGFPVRLLYTRVNNPELYRVQVEAIRTARKYIWINNAYFSDNEILYGLINARRRGVDVRIILPQNGNHQIMNKSNIITANILFRNGIKVYFYPGMSHIKAAIYDDWLCTGSANFDRLSLKDNLELNVATSHAETVKLLKERLFEEDFKRSRIMNKTLDADLSDVIAEILAEQL
ncbi:MAG: phosphatidylserine/phosphatidylglycerophosphate/cardiolipin synthase family protein [Candidatus Omnitrophota bacterium]